ncbi:hypothetical protein [Nocardia sp. CS682]|uniref:hypothetical protein n=1 Tax=Nocardia sp. CS682 TaxID=1047172 RepID=UPI001F1175D0|nr:hypothetical protein [Nocardia sp. CS682]
MAHSANLQQRVVWPSRMFPAAVLVLCTVLVGGWFAEPGSATADQPGCTTDVSVPNELTVTCDPGSGVGEHAFIRCRDLLGMPHTHIGATIGPDGGWSRANCAPAETGPV